MKDAETAEDTSETSPSSGESELVPVAVKRIKRRRRRSRNRVRPKSASCRPMGTILEEKAEDSPKRTRDDTEVHRAGRLERFGQGSDDDDEHSVSCHEENYLLVLDRVKDMLKPEFEADRKSELLDEATGGYDPEEERRSRECALRLGSLGQQVNKDDWEDIGLPGAIPDPSQLYDDRLSRQEAFGRVRKELPGRRSLPPGQKTKRHPGGLQIKTFSGSEPGDRPKADKYTSGEFEKKV